MYRVVPQKVTQPCPQPLDVSYSLSTVVGRNHGGIGVPRNATSRHLVLVHVHVLVPFCRAALHEKAGDNKSRKSKRLNYPVPLKTYCMHLRRELKIVRRMFFRAPVNFNQHQQKRKIKLFVVYLGMRSRTPDAEGVGDHYYTLHNYLYINQHYYRIK